MLVEGGDRHWDASPSDVGIGAVRLAGWQVHPLAAPASFTGQDAYLIKLNYELALEPEVPAPRWFEVGFRLKDAATAQDAVALDALPRSVFEPCGPAAYSVGGYLNFTPGAGGAAAAVNLPALGPFIDVFGCGSPEIRWRYLAPGTGDGRDGACGRVRPGSYVSWITAAVPAGCVELDVEVFARYDLDPDDALGCLPGSRSGGFRLALREPQDGRGTERCGSPSAGLDSIAPPRGAAAREPAGAVHAAPPNVFVSYAHDDEQHKESVRALSEFLLRCGLDVHLDRWNLQRRRDWSQWGIERVRTADFVLVVASPKCRRVGDGDVGNDQHRGLQSELALLRELLQKDRAGWLPKVLPVVLPGGSVEDLPLFLQPQSVDHYLVEELTVSGAEDLLRALTAQPAYVRPAVAGSVVQLPPRLAALRDAG